MSIGEGYFLRGSSRDITTETRLWMIEEDMRYAVISSMINDVSCARNRADPEIQIDEVIFSPPKECGDDIHSKNRSQEEQQILHAVRRALRLSNSRLRNRHVPHDLMMPPFKLEACCIEARSRCSVSCRHTNNRYFRAEARRSVV